MDKIFGSIINITSSTIKFITDAIDFIIHHVSNYFLQHKYQPIISSKKLPHHDGFLLTKKIICNEIIFLNLGIDCIRLIFDYLSERDILALRLVNKNLSQIKFADNLGIPIDYSIFCRVNNIYLKQINKLYGEIVHVKMAKKYLDKTIGGIIKLPHNVCALTLFDPAIFSKSCEIPNLSSLTQITHLCVRNSIYGKLVHVYKFNSFPPRVTNVSWSYPNAVLYTLPFVLSNTLKHLFIDGMAAQLDLPDQVETLKFGKNYLKNIWARNIIIRPTSKLIKITFEWNNIEIKPLLFPESRYEVIQLMLIDQDKFIFSTKRIVSVDKLNINMMKEKIKLLPQEKGIECAYGIECAHRI